MLDFFLKRESWLTFIVELLFICLLIHNAIIMDECTHELHGSISNAAVR